ncbi:MAG: 50S ribosomal protein L32 [Sumerlaeia bacterium]
MPNPKRRHCGSRQGKGRAHKKLHPTQLISCESCGAPKMRHRICPSCGTYKGATLKVVITEN